MGIKWSVKFREAKLKRLKQEVQDLETEIEELATLSRKNCPVNLICRCPAIQPWNGVCKMAK